MLREDATEKAKQTWQGRKAGFGPKCPNRWSFLAFDRVPTSAVTQNPRIDQKYSAVNPCQRARKATSAVVS